MQSPIFDTGEEQAAFERGVAMERARQAKEQANNAADPSAELAKLRVKAEQIVKDEEINSQDRLTHLRAFSDTNTVHRFQEAELKRMVWDARRALSGPAGPIEQGGQLHISEAPWLWDGVFIRGVTNLITAPPKLGKSRLLTSLFGALANGRDEFLGRKLHRGEQPKFLIVGSDQPERDWAKCLKLAGLLTPDNRMWDCITALFHKGAPLHLDDEGIDTIAGYCRKHPDLIVGIDSYHACTAQLGLQEKDASFADPLLDLQEATAGYHPTIALIHHSKKGGGTRASEASRGSNALPGAVSQTITLNWCQDNTGNPLAPRDNRVKLSTEGREDMPLDMVIEQTDAGWICHGSGEEVAQAQAIQDVIDKLTDVQHQALRDMAHHWNATMRGVDAVHLANALNCMPNRAAETISSLDRKHLVQRAGERPAGPKGGKPAKLYRPVDVVLPLFPLASEIPEEPVVDVDATPVPPKAITGLTDKTDDLVERVEQAKPEPNPASKASVKPEKPANAMKECEQCGKHFEANTRGRPKKHCSKKCKDKAANEARRTRRKDSYAGQSS